MTGAALPRPPVIHHGQSPNIEERFKMADIKYDSRPKVFSPALGGFVLTETGKDILRSLRLVQEGFGEYVGLVAGAPGVGKSEAVRYFAQSCVSQVVVHRAVQGEGGIWNLANELCRSLWIAEPNARQLPDERRRIGEAIGPDRMLIIDEAQYLVQHNTRGKDDWQAFEWLRSLGEASAVAIVFVGDLALRQLEAELPQLWRRMRRRIIVSRAPKADVQAVAGQWGVTDSRAVDLLFKVAGMGGAIGDVVSACQHALLLSGENTPALEDILAALEDLRLLPGRGSK